MTLHSSEHDTQGWGRKCVFRLRLDDQSLGLDGWVRTKGPKMLLIRYLNGMWAVGSFCLAKHLGGVRHQRLPSFSQALPQEQFGNEHGIDTFQA